MHVFVHGHGSSLHRRPNTDAEDTDVELSVNVARNASDENTDFEVSGNADAESANNEVSLPLAIYARGSGILSTWCELLRIDEPLLVQRGLLRVLYAHS